MKIFPIDQIYTHEANALLEAKKSVSLIHKTGDINASGDELEMPVRKMLAKKATFAILCWSWAHRRLANEH